MLPVLATYLTPSVPVDKDTNETPAQESTGQVAAQA
jgi:hypothetical protein